MAAAGFLDAAALGGDAALADLAAGAGAAAAFGRGVAAARARFTAGSGLRAGVAALPPTPLSVEVTASRALRRTRVEMSVVKVSIMDRISSSIVAIYGELHTNPCLSTAAPPTNVRF